MHTSVPKRLWGSSYKAVAVGSTPTTRIGTISFKTNEKGVSIILVSEAAKKIGMNTQTLRLALQQNKFDWGVAIQTSPKRFTYYINEARLEQYLLLNKEKEV